MCVCYHLFYLLAIITQYRIGWHYTLAEVKNSLNVQNIGYVQLVFAL